MVACERPPEGLRCPRCDSVDTKFCYYNNYNASQPRHFCKTCKRYWTAGGTLRNVPVGGGLRKNKKSKLLNHVKDMLSSSSPDEFLHGALSHPSISHDAFAYDVPRPLVFAPPLFINGPTLSADASISGTPGLQAFRSPGPLDYGYFAESRIDGSHSMDPSLLSSLDASHPPDFRGGNQLTLPGNLHHQMDVGFEHFRGSTALDQGQPYSGDVSEVPSEPSQASSEVLKDHQLEHVTAINQCQSVNVEQAGEGSSMTGLSGHQSSCEREQTEKEDKPRNKERMQPSSEQLMMLPVTQFREKPTTEDEDDELGNVVNVRYPYDWEQVSEVVFERMPDFFQLSGY